MKYKNEREIEEVVRGFEAATIARGEWKHAEHLTVALYYVDHYDLDAATARMREGIFKMLAAFEIDLSKEMPYHETMTVFWMKTVAEFNSSASGASLLQRTNELIEKFDKDHPLRFYSRELLFSDHARSVFVKPDLIAASSYLPLATQPAV